MGYTQASWDNLSGREQLPWSFIKPWLSLTEDEKGAAYLLGYTKITWDNRSGKEVQPDTFYKYWDELAKCGEGENLDFLDETAFIPNVILL